MRKIAILCVHDGVDIEENIVKRLPEGSEVLVFMRKSLENGEFHKKLAESGQNPAVKVEFYPDELRTHGPKLRNFVSKRLLETENTGFVHVIEDCVQIFGDVGTFLPKIEEMMEVLGLKTWLDTSCDGCNLVYEKYNPRFYVAVDEPEAAKTYSSTVAWCSNANTVWICYDMERCSFEDMRFEERFRFPMYYIIEFLARRRNVKSPGQLEYMNLYPSIPEELGVFRTIPVKNEHVFGNSEIEAEGAVFSEMKVDNHPDMSIEAVMEDMRNRIVEYGKSR